MQHSLIVLAGLGIAAGLTACSGAPTDSSSSPVENEPPTLSVSLSPQNPDGGSTIVAITAKADPDDDAVLLSYAWMLNGAASAQVGPELAGPFSPGDEVAVTVSASDALNTTTATASVTIVNRAPGAPTVRIVSLDDASTSEPGVDTLRCEVAQDAVDADGDALSYSITWTVDGVAWAGRTDLLENDTVAAEDTSRGKDWVCSVTATDGTDTSGAGTASVHYDDPAPNQYAFRKLIDLPIPSDIAVLPDDTVLVTTLYGEVYHVDVKAGTILSSLTLGVPDDLIGITVDPRFGDGDHDSIFIWTAQSCVLQRWHVDSLDPFTVSDEVDILSVACPPEGQGHCGGDVKFYGDVDGQPVLYLVTGPVGDLPQASPNEPPGKLWAMTVDDAGVASPAYDSPYGDGWYVGMGFRNPWRIVICGDGLCIPDPGIVTEEEFSFYDPALAESGANFGFPACEGPCSPEDPDYVEPFFWYSDDEETWIADDLDANVHAGFVNAPVVGVRLDDAALGGRLDGNVLVADVYDGWVRGVPLDDSGVVTGDSIPLAHLPFLISMEELSDGTVIAAEMGGSLQQMVFRADRNRLGAPGERLSDTTWADGGVAYTPRYPLWANGAGKNRFIQLPAGQKIDTSNPLSWVYPEGTKLWKDFDVDGLVIETRLIEKRADGWVAGTYVWNGDDAYLSNGFRTDLRLDDGTIYTVPSSEICADCHQGTRGAEWALGIDTFKLGDAGIAAFADIISDPVGAAPTVAGDPRNQYARGYLDGNCAYCHNPSGITASTTVLQLDFRYSTPFDEMGLDDVAQYYNANPNLENGSNYLEPTDPSESVLTQVIYNGDMPPLLIKVPDDAAASQINDWIADMAE